MFVRRGYWLVLLAVYSVALADFEVRKDGATESDINKFVDNDPLGCYCGKHGNCTLSESGTKYCHCENGYVEESEICEDIDECLGYKPCNDEHARCVNTPGSYRCDCEAGYSVVKDSYKVKSNICMEEYNPWKIAWIVVGSLFGLGIVVLLIWKCTKYMDQSASSTSTCSSVVTF
ncbi:hypothetical protein JTE90_015639 [Oedothorax gibbosus]|uniref:EGF-like domain-containing protein n=1 Tax=Oedothorax gibbosus TaxID=931172 RepID=A0AAV6UT12_9ARAC|nr:hypothetical protein JTE90_015639 [Oedothorax gibbosus]